MPGDAVSTIVAALAAAGVLVACAVIDERQRRIPNACVLALVGLWALWRLALGAWAAVEPQASIADGAATPLERFWTAAWESAPLMFPSALDGLVAAVLFGGGLLVFTLAYEAISKKDALGGGDIKLMGAMALFLGPSRSAACLLIACLVALAIVWVRRASSRSVSALPSDSGSEARSGQGGKSAGDGTFPFAPALLAGAVIAFAPSIALLLGA